MLCVCEKVKVEIELLRTRVIACRCCRSEEREGDAKSVNAVDPECRELKEWKDVEMK